MRSRDRTDWPELAIQQLASGMVLERGEDGLLGLGIDRGLDDSIHPLSAVLAETPSG